MSTWIPISERLPTREETNGHETVWAVDERGTHWIWNYVMSPISRFVHPPIAWHAFPRYTPPKPSPTDNEGEGTVSGQFWVVWAENGGTPVVQHPNEASATFEAERLARLNPDKRFYVLEAIGLRCVTNMMRVDLRGDGGDKP